MTDSPLIQDSAAPEPCHEIRRMWAVAALRCAGCGQTWEQPEVAGVGETFVCPRCLHAAPVCSSERTIVTLPRELAAPSVRT